MHPDEPDRPGDARRDTEPIPGMGRSDPAEGAPPPYDSAGYPASEFPPPSEPDDTDPYGTAASSPSSATHADDPYDSNGLPPTGPRRVLPVEPEPSSYVARYLFPTEKYRGEWRRHWIHIIVPIVVLVLATFLMGFVSSLFAHYRADIAVTVVVVLWLISLVWVTWKVLDWFQDRFILTNKRVMLVNGLVTRKVAMMPLVRVTDMKYQQSPLGRMLNYGTFVLESAGQDQALREVPHLPNPNELYLRVVEEMYEPEAVEARLGGEQEADGDA
jgi:membrane protein YdbS with pleckstrin-like domain